MAKTEKTAKNAEKSLFNKEDLKFLQAYINNASPTGFETEGQKLWLNYLKPAIDDYHVDNYGSVYGVINPQAAFKVVIEAHADEIAWFVSYITTDGLIYVRRNGGTDHQIAPAKRVTIHTDHSTVDGIFGWPAIHTRKGTTEKAPAIDNIFIDCGCTSKEEVEKLGIYPGCVVTYKDEFFTLNNRYFGGRALDNRIGGFMIAKVAHLLKENKKKLPFGLYIVNSVQEEIGLRGAQMMANTIQPNCAIITDVAHDTTTPMIDKITQGDYKCGNGPILTVGPAVHRKLLKHIREAAERTNIKVQMDAASSSTGTDTDAFAYSNSGIPAALISLPLRYMHTTVEMVHQQDVEAVIKLIYESLLTMTPKFDFKYLK